MKRSLSAIGLLVLSVNAWADGKITGLVFSGPDDPSHQNIVQIQIEGGFSYGNCNTTFAAIRNSQDRQHMISFALAAYATGKPVAVKLNQSDTYYSDRCTISRITSAN